MKSPLSLLATTVLCGALSHLPSHAQTAAAPKSGAPNILFLFADDLGWGDLGVTGSATNKTPNIDKLARAGALWTQFYVASAVCSPSRAACLTGQFPARLSIHGHFSNPELNTSRTMPQALDPAAPTLPRALQNAGYATAHFGKWHLGRTWPLAAYGFTAGRDDRDSEWKLWGEPEKMSAKVADETIAFIKKQRAERPNQPFYLQSWFIEPHAPLRPSAEQMEPFANLTFKNAGGPSPAQTFAAAVGELDRNVGRIVDALDEAGLGENTLIIFSSDNGPEEIEIGESRHSAAGSPGPFRGRKRSIYGGGVRVPLITRWKGKIAPNQVKNDAVLAAVDLFPTLGALGGALVPQTGIDGENQSGTLLGAVQKTRKPLFWEWRFRVWGHPLNRSPQLAVRDGNWKLLMNPDRSRVELYDMKSDPFERQNLAPQNSRTVRRLSTLLLGWQKTLPAGFVEPAAGKADYAWPKPLPAQ